MGSGLLSEQYVGDYISKTRVGETCSQNILGLLHNDIFVCSQAHAKKRLNMLRTLISHACHVHILAHFLNPNPKLSTSWPYSGFEVETSQPRMLRPENKRVIGAKGLEDILWVIPRHDDCPQRGSIKGLV